MEKSVIRGKMVNSVEKRVPRIAASVCVCMKIRSAVLAILNRHDKMDTDIYFLLFAVRRNPPTR